MGTSIISLHHANNSCFANVPSPNAAPLRGQSSHTLHRLRLRSCRHGAMRRNRRRQWPHPPILCGLCVNYAHHRVNEPHPIPKRSTINTWLSITMATSAHGIPHAGHRLPLGYGFIAGGQCHVHMPRDGYPKYAPDHRKTPCDRNRTV